MDTLHNETIFTIVTRKDGFHGSQVVYFDSNFNVLHSIQLEMKIVPFLQKYMFEVTEDYFYVYGPSVYVFETESINAFLVKIDFDSNWADIDKDLPNSWGELAYGGYFQAFKSILWLVTDYKSSIGRIRGGETRKLIGFNIETNSISQYADYEFNGLLRAFIATGPGSFRFLIQNIITDSLNIVGEDLFGTLEYNNLTASPSIVIIIVLVVILIIYNIVKFRKPAK